MSLSSFLNWAQMMNSSFIEIKIVTLHWRASIILMVTMQYFKYFISTLLKPHYIIQKKILSWTIPSFQIFTYLSHLHLWYIRKNSEQIVQFGEDRSSFYVTENTSENLQQPRKMVLEMATKYQQSWIRVQVFFKKEESVVHLIFFQKFKCFI